MADAKTQAPVCPECGAGCGTPVNAECGVERGRWYGPDNANLKCPMCGTAWIGDDHSVADAWRAFVEWEQQETATSAPPVLEGVLQPSPGSSTAGNAKGES